MAAEALLIHGGRVFTPGGWLEDGDVLIEGGRIAGVGRDLAAVGARRRDARGQLVVPGLMDIHIHGAAGAMCEAGEVDALHRISKALAGFGVTGFLATLATMPFAALGRAAAAVAAAAGSEPGARILGVHLEGPCLNPLRAGAQAVPHMRALGGAELDELQALSGGRVRLVTLAPEVDGAMDLLAHCRRRGIAVAIGHSDATEAEMAAAVRAGASHVTHLFNAMRPLHHREAGVIGVGLTDDTLSVELIADGHHLSPRIVDLGLRCKPPGKAVLVSDAVAALGLADGEVEMFGVACRIEGGAVRLRDGGQLAGSCLRLDQALRNLRAWLPALEIGEVIRAATAAPAAVVGEIACGRIEAGCIADVAVLDVGLEVVATICRGVSVWER